MKKHLLCAIFALTISSGYSQSCQEWMNYVKSESYGTTYTSYNSDAISKVTFYNVYIDYQTYYFAIVCFKQEYSYGCNEYIYLVGSNTKMNYSINHYESAGKAFWNYIQPYNENLGCAPNFN
jgi:hypothetical protein